MGEEYNIWEQVRQATEGLAKELTDEKGDVQLPLPTDANHDSNYLFSSLQRLDEEESRALEKIADMRFN